jgi:hypothetical protein
MSQQQVASGNMADLRREYQTLQSQYDNLWEQSRNVRSQEAANKLTGDLKALNVRLGDVLERMMSFETETPTEVRDELVRRLAEIQKDYNGLLVATDDLKTLRRIRAHETGEGKKTLTIYLFAFVALAVLLLVVIFWKGRSQTSDTAAIMPTSPAATTAFT